MGTPTTASGPLAPPGRGWRCGSSAPGGAGVRGRSYDDRKLYQVSWCGRLRWRSRVVGTGQAMTRQREKDAMADLIAIGYPDETTAFAAADQVGGWPPT